MQKNNLDYTLLHCVSIYPTPLNFTNLNRLNFLKRYSTVTGLSDHTNPTIDGLLIVYGRLKTRAIDGKKLEIF